MSKIKGENGTCEVVVVISARSKAGFPAAEKGLLCCGGSGKAPVSCMGRFV